ncbi:MAG: Sec-independent protein translocase protein TatB [Pseudomonadota bacterium]|nr:Sec-independent protein translocase protein TatB [Pseudomonadota bacterium]
MFDIGMFEMTLIGVIALLILGPERMPEAARAAGRWVGKARAMITGIKADVASQMSVTELNELRQLRNDLTSAQGELNKFKLNATDTLNEQVPLQATAAETLPVAETPSPAATESPQKNKKPDQA